MTADEDQLGTCVHCGTSARDRRILASVRGLLEAVFGRESKEIPDLRVNSVARQARIVLREAGVEMKVSQVADAVLQQFGEGGRKLPVKTSVSAALAQMADKGIWGVERVRRGVYRALSEDAPLLEGDGDGNQG